MARFICRIELRRGSLTSWSLGRIVDAMISSEKKIRDSEIPLLI
jgi:hypothetical protein